jgi:hypothetical protein
MFGPAYGSFLDHEPPSAIGDRRRSGNRSQFLGFHLELRRLELSAPRGFDPRREQERRSTMPQRALKVLAFNCSLKSANGREKSSTDVLLKQLLDA